MESPEFLESMGVSNASAVSCGDGLKQHSSSVNGSENLGDVLLEDLDSYLEDIDERLTISRMVSDSVIKGMVNAVTQEAAEKIAMKELEVAGLKETVHFFHVGVDETGSSRPLIRLLEPKSTKYGLYSNVLDSLVEYDRMRESLGNLRVEAKDQFKKLKKEINSMKGCSSIRKISSGSELVGLGGILQDKVSDETLDSLKNIVDNLYKQVDDVVYLCKASLLEWQREREIQEEIEAMVIGNCIQGLQKEFEERLWDQTAHFYGSESVNWLENIKEISNLRQELDGIYKLLSMSEIGQLTPHGFAEINEEGNNSKRTDPFCLKVLSNHVSSPTLLLEGNGKHESKSTMPKNLDPAQLKHMSKDELMNYFKTQMTEMKRNHELQVHSVTEKYFSLKRIRKEDKEFDKLKKKLPEVILKLDDILVENEKLPAFNKNSESLGSLKERLDALLSENNQLRDLLTEKKKEVKDLSSQVSDAAEKMSMHSLAEAGLLKRIGNLKCAIEDAHVEASINEDVYKCVLREVTGQIKCDSEESDMQSTIMQDIFGIFLSEAARDAEAASKCEIQDTGLQSVVMQGLMEVIFREIISDVEAKLSTLNTESRNENKIRASLEMKALELEDELRLEVEEKKRLKQEILEKENLALEAEAALAKEKEQYELASLELNDLKDRARHQQKEISFQLVKALEQIDLYKDDVSKLNQKLERAVEKLRESDEERNMLLAVTREKQNTLLSFEAKERVHRDQMESMTILVHRLSKAVVDFECRVAEDTNTNILRLENMSSQLSSLIQKANILSRTGVLYRQRLERRCSDLKKAESEVDLLGDEVDTLLSLLEKIYIALDHYSPILQHYPGIIDVLKLVRRELSGESTKLV